MDLYIVGNSSNDTKDIIDGFINSGANEFIVKPASILNLRYILDRALTYLLKNQNLKK